MAFSESNFGIRITSTADIAALKETLTALEADTAAAERMGLAVGNAHAQIDALKSKISGYEDASRKAYEATHALELSHHELKTALHEVLQAGGLPELSTMLHGLFSPASGIAFAGVFAIQQLSKYLEELRQKAVDAAQAMRELREGLIQAHVTATMDAARAQAEFQRSLDAVGQSQDQLSHQTERSIQVLQEQTKHTETLVDLNFRLYQARLKAAVESGQTTPQQADAQTQALERQARALKDQAEDEQALAEIAAKRNREASARGEIETDEATITGLSETAVERHSALIDSQDRKKTFDRQLEDAQKSADAADAAFGTADHGRSYRQTGVGPHGEAVFGSVANDATEAAAKASADKALESARSNVDAINNKIALDQEDYNATQELIKAKQAEVLSRKELIIQLRLEADEKTADFQRRKNNRAQQESVSDATQSVQNDAALAQRIRNGTATAAELAQHAAAGERGPQASLDASHTVSEARAYMANLRGHSPSAAESAQIEVFAGEVLGFLQNHASQLASQHESLANVMRDLKNLRQSTRSTGFQ